MAFDGTTIRIDGRDSLGTYCQSLKTQLKRWESKFVLEHGRKAERDDIKKDPAIAQKYKEYSKLRNDREDRVLCSQPVPSPSQSSNKRHRSKGEQDGGHKRQKQNPAHPSEIDPYDAPINTTPSAVRTFIGPTPQKNGQVLGLFDSLSPSNAIGTPSKSGRTTTCIQSAHFTPSRSHTVVETNGLAATPSRNSRALGASEKQDRLNSFLTPSTRRFVSKETPKAGATGNDETPEFLLRGKRQIVSEAEFQPLGTSGDAHDILTLSPIAIRMPPRTAGKGLSDLVKGLRTMEEERLDEDLDVLRELEGGETRPSPPRRTCQIEIECSQIPPSVKKLPLGADGEHEITDDEDHTKEGLDRDGKPLKIWKKRGQKRTTRKVNIKPTISKWKPEAAWEPDRAKDKDEDVRDLGREEKLDLALQDGLAKTSKAVAVASQKKQSKFVNPAAHANYRALKIKKKGSRWKGRGRFGAR